MSQPNFYLNSTTTTAFVVLNFGFNAKTLATITNDSANTITISWDGTNTHYELKAGEVFNFPEKRAYQVYVKSAAGGDAFRITAY